MAVQNTYQVICVLQGAAVNRAISNSEYSQLLFSRENASTTILQLPIYPSVMMGSWNGAYWAFAMKAYYKNSESYLSVQHIFWNHFNIPCNDLVPSAHAIKTWIKNFKETGSTLKKKSGSVKSVHMPENVARVEGALQSSPTRSAHRHTVLLGISNRSIRRILRKDLHYHPYKILG
jgi:hypothetical protein